MKILVIAPYIINNKYVQFSHNKSGLGKIINEICYETSKECDIYLLTHILTKKIQMGKINIISHTKKDIIRHAKFSDYFLGVKSFFITNKLLLRLKYIYYGLNFGYVKYIIKKINPDIVHFHGIFYTNILGINYCINHKIKFTITLHGLIYSNNIIASNYLKRAEKNVIHTLDNNNILYNVISSGMKSEIVNKYNICNAELIHVICNGTCIGSINEQYINIRNKYNISTHNKILIYVSSLGQNKNQISLIEAYNLLPNIIKNELTILIIGTGDLYYTKQVNDKIKQYNLSKKIMLTNYINHSLLVSYYKQADINVLLSNTEGFGISIIEGYTFGLPVLTYNDLGATFDLYNEQCMLKLVDRSIKTLANGIVEIVDHSWDKKNIINFSKQFSTSEMALKYVELYHIILEKSNTKSIV